MKTSVLPKSIALVVDDHPETLQFLIDALEAADMTVLVATDGARALEQIQYLMPDLILLDAVMPGMDGFETCRALKSGPAPDVPVIFMTGLDETEHVVRGFEAGGIDYLTKPISPQELIARMRVHLANARSVRNARTALDVSGQTMLAADTQGRVRWATPQAQQLLARIAHISGGAIAHPSTIEMAKIELPPQVRFWIAALAPAGAPGADNSLIVQREDLRVRFGLISRLGEDEVLLAIRQDDPIERERNGTLKLQQRLNLTVREAEVLFWLSRGKANRDIADILGMSTRTVNKHLEHIYAKLGVESRAGAVALAMQGLQTA